MKNTLLILLFGALCFAGGWLLQPREEVVTTTIRTEQLDVTFFRLPRPKPVKVSDNINAPMLLFARDTIVENGDTVYLQQSVDTAALIADYMARREYRLDFSTDTIGTFVVDAVVSQNRLLSADATIAPIRYTTEVTHSPKRKRWAIVAGVSGGIAPNGKAQVVLGISGGFKIVEF